MSCFFLFSLNTASLPHLFTASAMAVDIMELAMLGGVSSVRGPESKKVARVDGEVEDGFRLLDQLFKVAVRTLEDGYLGKKQMKRKRLRR